MRTLSCPRVHGPHHSDYGWSVVSSVPGHARGLDAISQHVARTADRYRPDQVPAVQRAGNGTRAGGIPGRANGTAAAGLAGTDSSATVATAANSATAVAAAASSSDAAGGPRNNGLRGGAQWLARTQHHLRLCLLRHRR